MSEARIIHESVPNINGNCGIRNGREKQILLAFSQNATLFICLPKRYRWCIKSLKILCFSPKLRIVDNVRTIFQWSNEYVHIPDLALQA